jgi:hypothetical protein
MGIWFFLVPLGFGDELSVDSPDRRNIAYLQCLFHDLPVEEDQVQINNDIQGYWLSRHNHNHCRKDN